MSQKGKRPQKKIGLPNGWWPRLKDICRSKWQQPGTRFDIAKFVKISPRSLAAARAENVMTEELFMRLSNEVGYDSYEDLLNALGKSASRSLEGNAVPRAFALRTQHQNPQWADYRDFLVNLARPWALRCRVVTDSAYFRFGFKLLTKDGRVFGDGSIKSSDANMIVHIGRNNWDRPSIGVSSHDVFLTSYMSGEYVEEKDRRLFKVKKVVDIPIQLTVDRSHAVILTVSGEEVFRHIVPPSICNRVAVYGWGDREEFHIDVSDLALAEI